MKKPKAAAPPEHNQDASERNHLGLERLIFFSDAVFAIAITLLVLDIHLPAGAESANDSQMLSMLTGLWGKYLAYLLSFWVIGLYWISHHRKFLLIKRFDNRLLSLNLLLLMAVAFIPFPTSVLSESVTRTASVFYALVMALGGVLMALLWWHAIRNHNLIDPQLDRQLQRREMVAPLATAAIFLISIGIAFWNAGLVRLFWLLIVPVSLTWNARRHNP